MDMKYSYDELTGKSESNVVGLYTDWIYDGANSGNATIKAYTPGYEGDGATHILFMDYHHNRMLNGGYYDTSESLLSSHPHCTNIVMPFAPAGYEARTGFREQTKRMSYIMNSLNGEWSPQMSYAKNSSGDDWPSEENLQFLFLEDNSFGSTCKSWEINILKYEPLFLSIAYQIDSKWLIDRLNNVDSEPFQECIFPDIQGSSIELQDAVKYLCGKSIISGYCDGTFKPDQPVTRAEFLKMVLLASTYSNDLQNYLKNNKPQKSSFSDVNYDHWALGFIEYAKVKGIVSGYSDTKFKPDSEINRSELCKVILNTFGKTPDLKTLEIKGKSLVDGKIFKDITSAEWYAGFVAVAKDLGFVKGTLEGYFEPARAATRGETALVIYRAINP